MNNESNKEYLPIPLSQLEDEGLKFNAKFENYTELLEDTIKAFGIDVKVENFDVGDTVTRYNIKI